MAVAIYFLSIPVGTLEFKYFDLSVLPAQFSFTLSILAAISMGAVGLYSDDVFLDYRLMAIKIVLAFTLVAPLIFLVTLFFHGAADRTFDIWSLWYIKATAVWFGCVVAARAIFLQFANSDMFKRHVIVVGTGERAAKLERLAREAVGCHFVPVAFVNACNDPMLTTSRQCALTADQEDDALAGLAAELRVREIVVATDDRRGLPVRPLLRCKLDGISVVDYLTFWERESGRVDLKALQPSWFIYSDGFRKGRVVDALKRTFDIAVSLAILLVTFPVLAVTALLVKLESPGPAFYRQERIGLGGRPFTILKLRSMRVDAECDGQPQWAAQRDPRITRIGAIIRMVRIDELPQLFNVLRGDMSFVGPRPERPYFVEQLSKSIPFYSERHTVKPGITGWAQINYPYGASLEDARHKLSYDLYYLKNRTVFLDLIVLIQTVRVLLFPSGAR